MADRDELVRIALWAADDADRRLSPYGGILRQLARALATAPTTPDEDTCPRCGGQVVQPPRGRRRIYCSARCRKARRNAA